MDHDTEDPLKHLGLARIVVNRFLDRGLEADDLMQEAAIALIFAAQGYDPGRKRKFSTFAGKCILNRLIKETRKSGDWMTQRRAFSDDSQLARSTEETVRPSLSPYLDCLPENEARVLRLRFGLDREPLTLQEVGNHIGVTKERVRQIEGRAIKRIRQVHGIEVRGAA